MIRSRHLPFVTLVALTLFTVSLPAAAWGFGTSGSGKKATETRTVGSFSRLQIDGSIDADVRVGSAQSVVVEGDDNLLALVRTEVHGDQLQISNSESYNTRLGLRVRITVPHLEAIEVHGSGDVRAEGIKSETLKVALAGSGDVSVKGTADTVDVAVRGSGDVSVEDLAARNVEVSVRGSGDVRLRGTTNDLKVSVQGSGDVNCADLKGRAATVVIQGSGDVEVFASESVDATTSGSGNVTYGGNPPQVRHKSSGSGDLIKR